MELYPKYVTLNQAPTTSVSSKDLHVSDVPVTRPIAETNPAWALLIQNAESIRMTNHMLKRRKSKTALLPCP